MQKPITIELPQGDNRNIQVWYVEEKENSINLCVSIEDKYYIFEKALNRIANLTMAKIADYEHGYKKCVEIAKDAIK